MQKVKHVIYNTYLSIIKSKVFLSSKKSKILKNVRILTDISSNPLSNIIFYCMIFLVCTAPALHTSLYKTLHKHDFIIL